MRNFYITFTGQEVCPENLGNLNINLQDIAHHLTKIQRFGGALPFDKSYSVAEHSILMTQYALKHYRSKNIARMCLLHDASEAYLGDVISGLKACLPDYQQLETKMTTLIYTKYKIDHHPSIAKVTKSIDTRILLDEVQQLLPNRTEVFNKLYPTLKPLGVEITGTVSPYIIWFQYLALCEELNIED